MEEGILVFYIDGSQIYSGRVFDVEKHQNRFIFSIDSYGSCEGHHRIYSEEVGKTVFFSEEDAMAALETSYSTVAVRSPRRVFIS